MKIAIGKESRTGDPRVPILPGSVQTLADLGAEVFVESGIGKAVALSDSEYEEAGATVVQDRTTLFESADLVLRLNPPSEGEIEEIEEGTILVSFLDPFGPESLIETLAAKGITSLAMELIPRTTLAQKMDALSSQANLAGYEAVILAAEEIDKILPMMSTPAGTIPPARVFVIGAGVAGLQAIATAKRLGAIVEAYDTRPVVEEQVRSLGGRFVRLDIGETGETKDGYAKQLTDEQLARQREAMARHCEKSDIVITTAQVFGKKAPLIVTQEMLARMKPGSVVIDLAVETGGNVAGSQLGRVVEQGGVKIIGFAPLQARVARDASQMYSSNVTNLITHFWDKDSRRFVLDLESEIISSCLVTHQKRVSNERLK